MSSDNGLLILIMTSSKNSPVICAPGIMKFSATRCKRKGYWPEIKILPGLPVATSSNRIRIRSYPDRVAIPPRESKALANFRPGVAHEVVLTWGGDVVSLAVPTMGAKVRQSWAGDALRVPATGGPRLMFYASFGGGWLLEDIRLAAGSMAPEKAGL